MSDGPNLKLVAEEHLDDPLNTWPDHTDCHRRTLLGNWLFDGMCLRCWLERLASERAEARKAAEAAAKPPERKIRT